ncbi:MAG TPA: hypothetical protein VH210_09910 [Gaiellaceae bacterium]|jgi:hypothetical protein|nr:hypothetical protein [Gaiellaceae bacterium]
MRRRKWLVVALAAIAVLVTAGIAVSGNGSTNNKTFEYSVGLWGDMPYSDIQAQVGVPNVIADMNNSDISFSINDGDLKAGSGTPGSATPTTCGDALYTQAIGYLNALQQPAFFTPGDNDWTDCDRPANGGYNELERLQHERQVLFSSDRSFGQKTMQAEVQSTPQCVGTTNTTPGSTAGPYFPTPCVENRRWTFHKVTFATVNVQGTCNNRCSSGGGAPDPAGDPVEYQARNAADIQWLKDTFAQATAQNSAGVMIVWQADPGFDLSDGTRAPLRNPTTLVETDGQPDGYHDLLVTLRDLTIAFKKPVALVYGDSHYFRVDKPLQDASGKRLENFTRVETFGDNAQNGINDNHWVKALIDPQSRDVFAFQAQIVPANRVAVPAP